MKRLTRIIEWILDNHVVARFFRREGAQAWAERVMSAVHDAALNNLTEQEDIEAYGKAMLKYESKLAFLGSPEFWQAFRPEGEWANHAQYFYFLSDAEKIAYLEQLLPSSQ